MGARRYLAPMRRTNLLAVGVLALIVPLAAACGGGSKTPTASPTSGAASSVTVHAKDQLKFDKAAYTAKAGQVDIAYVNDGSLQHTLLIKGVDGFELKVGGTDHGSTTLKAGTYTFYCNLPGHEAAGMSATLTVS